MTDDSAAKSTQSTLGGNLDHGWAGNFGDARLDAPTFHRNHDSIVGVLRHHLGADMTGHALEVGSGSGQHVLGFASAFPMINWTPSDPDVRNRASIEAWRASSSLLNVKEVCDLDVSRANWTVPHGKLLRAIVCINVLHIAPWSVSLGLLSGARRQLDVDGLLFVYGPFKRDGAHTSDSNAVFDANLRSRNAEWGVRDQGELEHAAQACGLELKAATAMPANNFTLVFGHDRQDLFYSTGDTR